MTKQKFPVFGAVGRMKGAVYPMFAVLPWTLGGSSYPIT